MWFNNCSMGSCRARSAADAIDPAQDINKGLMIVVTTTDLEAGSVFLSAECGINKKGAYGVTS
jgi:hypothetical protein